MSSSFKEVRDSLGGVASTNNWTSLNTTGISGTNRFLRWIKVVKSYTDFSAAGTTKTSTVYQPNDGEAIHARIVRVATAVGGGTVVACTVSMGQYSTTDLLTAGNAMVVNNDPVPPLFDGRLSASTIGGTPSPVTATLISTGDTLNHLTAGNIIFWILISDVLSTP